MELGLGRPLYFSAALRDRISAKAWALRSEVKGRNQLRTSAG